MKQIWDDIKSWIEANAPHLLDYLAPGAAASDIEALETKLNIRFCQAFKDFYAIHNGQTNESESLIYGQSLLSLERIAGE